MFSEIDATDRRNAVHVFRRQIPDELILTVGHRTTRKVRAYFPVITIIKHKIGLLSMCLRFTFDQRQ